MPVPTSKHHVVHCAQTQNLKIIADKELERTTEKNSFITDLPV